MPEARATRHERDAVSAASSPVLAALAAAFQHVTVGMAVGAPDGRLVAVNLALSRMLGYEPDEPLTQDFAAIAHPDAMDSDGAEWPRLAAGEIDSYRRETWYAGDDGSILWALITVSALRDDDGRFVGALAQVQDVTAQKTAETAFRENEARLEASLRDSETRFRRAFEDAAIGMSLGGPDHRCLDANPAYCRIVGRPREAVVGRPFAELTHPDDVDAYTRQHARLYAGEVEAYELEKRYVRPDGTLVTGLLTVSAVRDASGSLLYDIGQLQDITAQKTAEAALQENEARLRNLVDHLPAALYRQDAPADGSATYVSPSFATLLGLDPDDLPLGFPAFFTRVHPDDREAVSRAATVAQVTGEPMDIEYRLRRRDDVWTWVHDRSALERDAHGQPRTWTGVLLDISERKRLEVSLRESEARFRSIFEGAGIGMALSLPEGELLIANRALEHLLGYAPGELEGMRVEDISYPDDLALQAGFLKQMRDGELDAYQFEKRFVRKDGGIVWGLLNATSVKDERGAVTAVIGQVQDITARKEAEAALRESEARFRALVQNDPDVILIIDKTLAVVYISPSSRTAFGVPPDALLGPIEANLHVVHPADLERALALLEEIGDRPGAVASAEARIRHRDLGWRWFLITVANKLEEPGIDGYLLNLRDITDRKHAALALEAALATQRAAIVELERLNQSKSRFLSTISHEFRTPLTAIIGYSELLAINPCDPVVIAEDAAVIHREASRLNRMVDDVLMVDRADAGHLPLHMEPVDLNTLVHGVVETFRPLTRDHQLSLSLDPSLPPIEGDRDRLAQAVNNLVGNAVKYSPGGGTVSIATRHAGDDVLFSVRDEGIGIAANDLPRVFDRFERVETGIAGRIAGAGLGLAIVQEIADLHGGRVWAESEPELGSTFYLVLPARGSESRGREVEESRRRGPGEGLFVPSPFTP